jgi:hypothetical protein
MHAAIDTGAPPGPLGCLQLSLPIPSILPNGICLPLPTLARLPSAVVEPCCDLGSVHRFLRHHRAPGVHKASLLVVILLMPGRCPVAPQRPWHAARNKHFTSWERSLSALLTAPMHAHSLCAGS